LRAVVYDLAKDLVTWDFVTWAVNVRELGYQHIAFQTKGIPAYGRKFITAQQVIERLHAIFIPAAKMLGLEYSIDERNGARHIGSSHYYDLRPDFKRMESPRISTHPRTVTIRDVSYKQHRNSRRDVWLEFARRIGARIIEEYGQVPISFEDRFALYAGAQMNWGVTNGPLAAAFLTPYPIRMFCADKLDRKGMSGHHILPGGQIQFSLPHQSLVWVEAITLEVLMKDYEQLQMGDRHPSMGDGTCRCALSGDFASAWRSTHPDTK
jgi:hypothetical protein